MKDFLLFRRMLTPLVIYLVYWVLVLGCVVVGLYDITQKMWWMGLAIIFFGPIIIRFVCEFIVLFFRMNETLTDIKNILAKNTNIESDD